MSIVFQNFASLSLGCELKDCHRHTLSKKGRGLLASRLGELKFSKRIKFHVVLVYSKTKVNYVLRNSLLFPTYL